MKKYTIYRCDFCDFESEDVIETESHEATHIGKGLTLEEYRNWKGLKELVTRTLAKLYTTKNEQTETEGDKILEELIDFERKHGILKDGNGSETD